MKKFKVTALVVALAMLFALPAWSAANVPTIGTGTIEIQGVNLSWHNLTEQDVSGSQTSYGIGALLGYFVTDAIEVGLSLNFSGTSSNFGGGPSVSSSLMNYEIAGLYNIRSGKLIPFVGIGLDGISGSASGGYSATGFGFAVAGGLRYLIVPDASINLKLSYSSLTVNPNVGDSFTMSDLGISSGMSIFVGGKK